MELKKYLESKKLSYRQFAKIAGIDHTTLCHFITGRTKAISLNTALKIIKASGGRISIESLTHNK